MIPGIDLILSMPLSILIGYLLNKKLYLLNNKKLRVILISLSYSLFFTPGVVIGFQYIGFFPAFLAIPMQFLYAPKFLGKQTYLLSMVVFFISITFIPFIDDKTRKKLIAEKKRTSIQSFDLPPLLNLKIIDEIKVKLDEAKIVYTFKKSDSSSISAPINNYSKIHVQNENNFKRAEEIINSTVIKGIGKQQTWQCPICSEEVESNFTECWNCGKPKI